MVPTLIAWLSGAGHDHVIDLYYKPLHGLKPILRHCTGERGAMELFIDFGLYDETSGTCLSPLCPLNNLALYQAAIASG